MRNALKRYYGRGDLHFLTFSCYQRKSLLSTPSSRDTLVQILGQVREQYAFLLVGYVVMPEHVHLLMGEPNRSTLSIVLQVLKQRVSRTLRDRGMATPKDGSLRQHGQAGVALQRFWQRRFYDFNVWNPEKRREKLDYMHANPVKRGLVEHPRDWPWSSWSFYETSDTGLVMIDPVD